MQAARAMGSSDGGAISIRPRRGGPLAVVGHLSMYIQTETMSQSLIPTRGAACRREPLERARSNRRSHGGPAPAAGTLEYRKRKRISVACRRARGGRVAHGGASSGVPGSQGMPQKRTSPGSFWKRYRRRPGNGVFGRHGFRTRISPARTTRAAWLIQRVHENHAARAMGISDRGIISVRGILVGAAQRRPYR